MAAAGVMELSDELYDLCKQNSTTAHLVSTRTLPQLAGCDSVVPAAIAMGLATGDKHERRRMRQCIASCSIRIGRTISLLEWCTALLCVQHRLKGGQDVPEWSQRWICWQELCAQGCCDVQLSDAVVAAS